MASTGTPMAFGILPPYRLISAIKSWGTLDVLLDAAQGAELALHRHPERVRELDGAAGDLDVAFERARRLAVGLERAIDHDRRETEVDSLLHHVQVVAVVE